VYQVELEMQNEELRHARLNWKSLATYSWIFMISPPSCYITLNHEAMIDDINRRGGQASRNERSKLLHAVAFVRLSLPPKIVTAGITIFCRC